MQSACLVRAPQSSSDYAHGTDGSSGDERESFLLLSLCECIKPVMII